MDRVNIIKQRRAYNRLTYHSIMAILRAEAYFFSFFSNPRTRAPFKPQKSNRGTSSWQLKQYAEATLGSGSLRKAVKLPEGEDKDEWLAVNSKVPATAIRILANNHGSRRFLQPDQFALRVYH